MIFVGVDIGAVSSKAVINNGKKMVGSYMMPTEYDIPRIATEVTERALKSANLSMSDVTYTVSTGYGRRATPFADEVVTEIVCHGLGAGSVIPETRTIIDIGGQDSKVIKVDAQSDVVEFNMNDKCAAGTGRFLEVMARALGMTIEEFSMQSLNSTNPLKISSVCTVFAESEVVSYRAEKKRREDIIAGLHHACARRVRDMAKNLELENTVVFTGGVAKNKGMLKALSEEIGYNIIVPEQPQLMGALGAALIAHKKFHRMEGKEKR